MITRLPSRPDGATIRKLGITLLALALVAGAGCAGVSLGGGGDGGSGGADLIEYVPQDQTIVVEFDMAITQDSATQQLLQASEDEGQAPADPSELQSSLEEFEAQTGLDPSGFQSAMVYGQTGGVTSVQDASAQEDVGVLIDSSWSTDELLSAIRSNESTSLTSVEYSESGVFYKIVNENAASEQDTYLGVHGDGVFVIGTEGPVRNSLDITYDGASALDGQLRQAYDNTRDGYVTFAMTMPEDTGSSGGMGMGVTSQIEAMTGVYYTNDTHVGVEGRIAATSTDAANNTATFIQFFLLSQGSGNQETQQALSNLQVSQDGSDVLLTYESDVQTLIDAAESEN